MNVSALLRATAGTSTPAEGVNCIIERSRALLSVPLGRSRHACLQGCVHAPRGPPLSAPRLHSLPRSPRPVALPGGRNRPCALRTPLSSSVFTGPPVSAGSREPSSLQSCFFRACHASFTGSKRSQITQKRALARCAMISKYAGDDDDDFVGSQQALTP